MGKKVIIPIAVVVILVIGGAVWLTQKDSGSQNNETAANDNSAATSQQATGDTKATFSPVATSGVSYEATLTSSKDGKTFTAVLQSDGKGNSAFEAVQSGQEFKIVMIGKTVYSCNGGVCYKLTNSSSAAFDPSNYQYTTDDINDLQKNATYKGTAACSSGTCDVWQVSKDNSEGTVYIDQATKRIMKAEGVYDGDKGTLEFVYKPVTITAPKNARTLPQ